MSKARFYHIWHGHFNDDVEDSLIEPDWFDACIDAHKKLGFEPKGNIVATHDPSDTGGDAKGFAIRQGNVFLEAKEIDAENANIGIEMACNDAIKWGADSFGWDCDGLGAPLRKDVAECFAGKNIRSFMFKGSEAAHQPESIYGFAEDYGFKEAKKNKDVFANKRAQNYAALADRCRKTWELVRAVEAGKPVHVLNPDDLISFSSDIKQLSKLRSELCRLPLKPNGRGLILLYTKAEMRSGITLHGGQKVVIPSPNMGDCCMMSFDPAATPAIRAGAHIPRPVQVMGRR
jgi:phage terminase large subunit